MESDPTNFPRLEKLYKTALKVQFQYDESINKAEKDKINSMLEKESKDNKKVKPDAKKNKNVVANESVPEEKEVFQFDDELKQAIKLEKTKYRYYF